jgi:hypothetical protein
VRSIDRAHSRDSPKDDISMRNRFTFRRLVAALALAAAVPAAALALSAGPASASISPGPAPAPLPGTCTPVAVKSAQLVKTPNGPAIEVTGIKEHADTKLRLDPDPVVFIRQPEYFPYTVNGCGGTGPVTKVAFTEDFPVPTSPVGKFGISVNDILVDLFPHVPVDA